MTNQPLNWLDIKEKGSISGIWFLVILSTLFGRPFGRTFLRILVPYYTLFHRSSRKASQQYFQHLHGRTSLQMNNTHLLRFAQCTLDRLFFVRGKVEQFEIESRGEEHLISLLDQKKGALLLGAHLGSFEAMQRMADARNIPINIVGFFRNAKMLNSVFQKLNPNCNARLLEFDPVGIDFILKVREKIENGEVVAILADRVQRKGRTTVVNFLGAPARFPTGHFVLASALKCPVYLTFGLHSPPNKYNLYCELFADKIELPRKNRDKILYELTQKYAQRLEYYCRLAPDNWFNFYDFWEKEPNSPSLKPIFEGNTL